MARCEILFIVTFSINCAFCDLKSTLHDRIMSLRQKNIELYGEPWKETIKLWELDLEDRLAYPDGDKQKLAQISEQWLEYYECGAHAFGRVTPSRHLPAVAVAVYEGAVAQLPCGLCVGPDQRFDLIWMYSESVNNATFNPIDDKETIVIHKNGTLTLYNAGLHDAGVYRCEVGASVGGPVFLEVFGDAEQYVVVKAETTNSSSPTIIKSIDDLKIFTFWTPWSECSQCDRIGRRRKYGLCYVGIAHDMTTDSDIENKSNLTTRARDLKLFEEFPSGIPCRSKYLPDSIRNIPAVQQRPNEIAIEQCKMACKAEIFELRSISGRIVERANNSGGIYSTAQRPPRQPPEPARRIVFATNGEPFNLSCPGTTLRDMPFTWRAGTKEIPSGLQDKNNEESLYIDVRDQLVFSAIEWSDANLYSCWQADNLAGTVKLEVWEGERFKWGSRVTLPVVLLVAAVALRVALRILHDKRRRFVLI